MAGGAGRKGNRSHHREFGPTQAHFQLAARRLPLPRGLSRSTVLHRVSIINCETRRLFVEASDYRLNSHTQERTAKIRLGLKNLREI